MVELWAENAVCSLNDFDAGECRRDQRRLEAHTLPVTYTRVRDRAIGGDWDGVWGLGCE